MVVYVDAASPARLTAAAQKAGRKLIEGGRLELRAFPSPITRRLSAEVGPRLCSVPWPRVYADLRDTGVRGEFTSSRTPSSTRSATGTDNDGRVRSRMPLTTKSAVMVALTPWSEP